VLSHAPKTGKDYHFVQNIQLKRGLTHFGNGERQSWIDPAMLISVTFYEGKESAFSAEKFWLNCNIIRHSGGFAFLDTIEEFLL